MRHRVVGKKLNRDMDHRKALLKNLAESLIKNSKIETTVAKAKFLRPYIERLVTRAKKSQDFNTVKYMRTKLITEDSIRMLIKDIAPKFNTRNGGYTRIKRTRNRAGDQAEMARIEFVD